MVRDLVGGVRGPCSLPGGLCLRGGSEKGRREGKG